MSLLLLLKIKLMMSTTGCLFNWDPPKSSKCQPVSKFTLYEHFHNTIEWSNWSIFALLTSKCRIYVLLSVIRQQMSAFEPFRGGGVAQCLLFSYKSFHKASVLEGSPEAYGQRQISGPTLPLVVRKVFLLPLIIPPPHPTCGYCVEPVSF